MAILHNSQCIAQPKLDIGCPGEAFNSPDLDVNILSALQLVSRTDRHNVMCHLCIAVCNVIASLQQTLQFSVLCLQLAHIYLLGIYLLPGDAVACSCLVMCCS